MDVKVARYVRSNGGGHRREKLGGGKRVVVVGTENRRQT